MSYNLRLSLSPTAGGADIREGHQKGRGGLARR